MRVKLWCCTTEGCGNYYGSSSQEHIDFREELKLGRPEDRDREGRRLVKGVRSDCPDCRGQRIPVVVDVLVQTIVTPAA